MDMNESSHQFSVVGNKIESTEGALRSIFPDTLSPSTRVTLVSIDQNSQLPCQSLAMTTKRSTVLAL